MKSVFSKIWIQINDSPKLNFLAKIVFRLNLINLQKEGGNPDVKKQANYVFKRNCGIEHGVI